MANTMLSAKMSFTSPEKAEQKSQLNTVINVDDENKTYLDQDSGIDLQTHKQWSSKANFCRLCAVNAIPNIGVHERRGLVEKIEQTTMISLIENTHLPKHICVNCYKMVHIISRYQNFCIKAQKELNQIFPEDQKKKSSSVVKSENKVNWANQAKEQFDEIILHKISKTSSNKSLDDNMIMEIDSEDLSGDQNESDLVFEEDDFILNESDSEEINQIVGFSCDWCYAFFKTESELKAHKIEELFYYDKPATNTKVDESPKLDSPEKNTWKCCGYYYKLEHAYAKHKKEVHNDKIKLQVKVHQARQRRIGQCYICGKLISTNISQHIIYSHEVKPERCPYKDCCGREFRNKHRLEEHIKKVHTRTGFKECNICGKMLSSWDKVKKHIKAVHENLREFKCKECGKAFHTQFNLTMHLKVHTQEINYNCGHCNKGFVYKHVLKTHMEREHMSGGKKRKSKK